jgi:hypothetical protein
MIAEGKFPLHFPILFEASRSSSLKEIARRAEDRALTPLEVKTLLEFKGKLFVCIPEIATGEQFWVVVTSETNFLFSGAALGTS